jgi:uncharacterized membrane protein
MTAETIKHKLQKLQEQQDSYVGMKVASYILVVILAIFYIVKNYTFYMKRSEPIEYTYQKIAFFSLIAVFGIHYLTHFIIPSSST